MIFIDINQISTEYVADNTFIRVACITLRAENIAILL